MDALWRDAGHSAHSSRSSRSIARQHDGGAAKAIQQFNCLGCFRADHVPCTAGGRVGYASQQLALRYPTFIDHV